MENCPTAKNPSTVTQAGLWPLKSPMMTMVTCSSNLINLHIKSAKLQTKTVLISGNLVGCRSVKLCLSEFCQVVSVAKLVNRIVYNLSLLIYF